MNAERNNFFKERTAMEKFSIRRNDSAEILVTAESLVSEGEKLGIDVVRLGLPKKIESIRESVKGDISIVLLGSFSDGKTSTIAGFAGEVLANMKIDTDESSDQLEHYKIPGNAGFEFVDTPGLFGTKEKEIDGASVRYSDVTKRYISEAHIVVYLCDAGVPLKESHVPVVKEVLRGLGKLESTVFVLNKMDEAGYDLLDEEDFREGCKIKKNALIKRLKDTIGLTAEEEARLRIVCIAAAPKGKGLDYWFADEKRAENYLRRSHIGDFRKVVQEVVDGTDEEKVRTKTVTSGVKDVLGLLKEGLSVMVDPLKRGSQRCVPEEIDNMSAELKSELEGIRNGFEEKLKKHEESLTGRLDGIGDVAALETFLKDIGMEGDSVDLGRVRESVLGMLSDAKSASESRIKRRTERIMREIERQQKSLHSAAKESETQLMCVRGGGEDASEALGVLSDVCAKFKAPTDWGAWATVATGALGVGGGAVLGATGFGVVLAGLAIAGLKFWKKGKDKEVLDDTKPKVRGGIERFFRGVRQQFCGEDAFYEKLAPGYTELCEVIGGYTAWLEVKRGELGALEAYGKKLEAELPKLEAL